MQYLCFPTIGHMQLGLLSSTDGRGIFTVYDLSTCWAHASLGSAEGLVPTGWEKTLTSDKLIQSGIKATLTAFILL